MNKQKYRIQKGFIRQIRKDISLYPKKYHRFGKEKKLSYFDDTPITIS
jgi:hypothetical protein